MAGVSYNIEVDGSDVDTALSTMLKRINNPATAWADVGEYLLLVHPERVARRQAPDGTPWAPVSPAYAERKRRGQVGKRGDQITYNPVDILVLRGQLRDTANYQVDGDGRGMSFGVNAIHAATHQLGDSKRGIQARPFIGVSNQDENEIAEIFLSYLTAPAG